MQKKKGGQNEPDATRMSSCIIIRVVSILNNVNVLIKFIVPSVWCCDCLMGCMGGLYLKFLVIIVRDIIYFRNFVPYIVGQRVFRLLV